MKRCHPKAALLAFLVSIFLILPPARLPAAAAPKVKPPASFDLQAIDQYLAAEARLRGRVGLSVAIVKDGRVVFSRGYGERSSANHLPVEHETLFAIGSVTKQFTSASILLLAEDGKLSVHDKVAKYFPNLTRAEDITLLDLMNHTSGYHDYYPLDFVDRRMLRPTPPDEVIKRYATGPLDFEPGSQYSYSNTGFLILGRVVEMAGGEPLGAFLQKRIFDPVGMKHTLFEPDLADARLAQGYTAFALSAPDPVAPEAKGWLSAAGGIYSTPSDLALWDLALMNGKVLKPESFQLMITPRELTDGTISDYGCGIGTRIQKGRRVLIHSGAVAGFNAWNGLIPSTHSAVIMTANSDEGIAGLPGGIFDLLLASPPATVPKVNGPTTAEAVKKFFRELQHNKINRSELADEFNWFLSPAKAEAASRRLKHFGSPNSVDVLRTGERGGLEVSTTRLTFKSGSLSVLMYRQPTGIIEQFFVNEN